MLKLTKKADYGLIALRHLALNERAVSASAKEIAEAYGIPSPLLAKILQKLARGGFLKSVHGTNGGYMLARDPARINTLEVIRVIEGPVILASCFHERSECGHTKRCSVREPLRRVHEAILKLLENTTIADLLQDEQPASVMRQIQVPHAVPVLPGI
jgi:Rrf2 family protein